MLQVRLLDASGMERLRVDFTGVGPRKLRANELQDKSDREYFKRTKSAAAGVVLVSDINLNSERGVVQVDRPVIRVATPIWQGGEFFGALIINADPGGLLKHITGANPVGTLLLASFDGQYMHHDDASKHWNAQLGTNESVFTDWPIFDDSAERMKLVAGLHTTHLFESASGDRELAATAISLGNGDYWVLALDTDVNLLMAESRQVMGTVLLSSLLIAGLAALIAATLSAKWARPIQRLALMADRLRQGDYSVRAPAKRPDEIGMLEHSFNEMAAAVESTVNLEQARRVAEEANSARSKFLANMSHEIRTPMTAILGYAELLEDEGLSVEERHEQVSSIRRSGSHLLEIINDILDLSKIESGEINIESIDVDPIQLVQDVMTVLRPKSMEQRTTLKIECTTGVPSKLRSDPTRLRQILFNLLGNAVKFTEAGVVKVEVGFEPTNEAVGVLQYDIIDTGVGIPESVASDLFDPFVQADASTTRKFGGTGLGLAISRRLANRLGGNVDLATSERNVGSTFRVTIECGRIADADLHDVGEIGIQKTIVANSNSRSAASKSLNCDILLIEDGFDNQRLFSHILRKAGAQVDVASNGQ